MIQNLQDYQTCQAVLCEWYDRVVENHELLKADVEALQEAKSNLQEGRFIVAVCGEMNSGKSTLLNALLFSEEVLPSHVTTMTAKIALMEGDETERVEATLYTPDEFRHVVEASKQDERSAQELAEARETARAEGLRESDLLTNPARIISEDGLDKLVQFAAVCSRGGIYSAYVNWVQLRADRPWLHQVTVADTPGTNDPNSERDKITREWIQRADAVVYVTFAGQAGMTGEDVKFIDEHLAHIDPQRRIIAVNKCDTQPNKEAILSHIRKTRDSDDLRMKVLLENDDQIVLVSGLGALVSAMQEAGRALSEDLTWHARELSGKGYLDPERHGLDRLRNVIERRIIATKGDGIIEAHQRRLDSVFENADAGISQDKAILTANRDAINVSQEERSEELARVRENITSIGSVVRNARKKFEKDLDEAKGPLQESINETIRKVLQEIDDDLSRMRVNNMAGIAMGIGNHLYRKRNVLAQAIRDIVSKIEGMLNQAENDLSEKLLASRFIVYQGPRYHLLPISSHTICKKVEAELRNKLDLETLQSTVKAATTWWQRFVDTSPGKSEAVKQLKIELESLLQETLDGLSGHIERELLNRGQEALETMEESCQHILEERQKLLEELQEKISSDEDKRQEIDDQLVELDRRKLQVDELKAEYDLARSAK